MTTRPTPTAAPMPRARLDGIRRAVEAGVTGAEGAALRELLAEVDRMTPFMPPPNRPCLLSQIELDIVLGMARGETCPMTAERTGRTVNTVKTHRLRIHRRLGLHTGTHVVGIALANGWITPHDVLRAKER
ncbi:response regulator transcription factor [Streptomyces sp. R302]|uniref:response regulator transcription factor n=1 Tax=unclassified Streptomyces TaxID=2593676 RepID=UPI00145FC1F8|nr:MULTISPECIES: response regulator transcription factor [unclassified Streptomyces]NML55306.1 response regulator transcription factor [Streptomyces sp. R301]NML80178.1 response regulator transcription factor [Streptomyces sp. R302]